jgi:hypothetical protein
VDNERKRTRKGRKTAGGYRREGRKKGKRDVGEGGEETGANRISNNSLFFFLFFALFLFLSFSLSFFSFSLFISLRGPFPRLLAAHILIFRNSSRDGQADARSARRKSEEGRSGATKPPTGRGVSLIGM